MIFENVKKKLISAFKKRLISKTVHFEIIGKEACELTFNKLKKFKQNVWV